VVFGGKLKGRKRGYPPTSQGKRLVGTRSSDLAEEDRRVLKRRATRMPILSRVTGKKGECSMKEGFRREGSTRRRGEKRPGKGKKGEKVSSLFRSRRDREENGHPEGNSSRTVKKGGLVPPS